jgi:hypothetical protein
MVSPPSRKYLNGAQRHLWHQIGGMLFDPQLGSLTEQAIQHGGGVPQADVDDLGVKGVSVGECAL